MKKSPLNPAALLLLIPALYVGGYFAFLALCSGNSHPPVPPSLMSNQISVVTGGHPVATRAAKIFRPAMRIHARLTRRSITLRSHVFS